MSNLTKAKCNALTRPGLPGDGGGLYLLVKSTGGKPWIQRITIQGKRRDLGLGSFPHVTLSKARAAALNRATVADGGDPLAGKRRGQVPRLRAAAATVYELHRPRWRSSKHAADGWATLERQALPRLGDIKVDAISRIDLLTPIWTSKPETARRVRQRVRTVMKRAVVARGHIEHNPAGEVIRAQPGRRSNRWCPAGHAERQGPSSRTPLLRSPDDISAHRPVPVVARHAHLSPLADLDRSQVRHRSRRAMERN